jgi:hypothetical protein
VGRLYAKVKVIMGVGASSSSSNWKSLEQPRLACLALPPRPHLAERGAAACPSGRVGPDCLAPCLLTDPRQSGV